MSIAVDLDGCLAEFHDWEGPEHIGRPVPAMQARVKQWMAQGYEVVIHTARVSKGDPLNCTEHIAKWLEENGMGGLRITAEKDYQMQVFWDDRAIAVRPNMGEPGWFRGDLINPEKKYETGQGKQIEEQRKKPPVKATWMNQVKEKFSGEGA